MKRLIGIAVAVAVAAGLVAGFGVAGAVTETAIDEGPTELYSVEPCRVFDSRFPVDAPWTHDVTRNLSVTDPTTIAAQGGKAEGCDVPAGASAVMLNVHALPDATGSVRVWPFGRIEPNAAVMAFAAGVRASNAISLPLCLGEECEFDLAAHVVFQNPANSGKPVHLIGDVVGYFMPAGVPGYTVFTSTQDFGPGGIGGAWCGAPEANVEDEGWVVVGGGAKLLPADIDKGVAVASSWPNLADPLNPGWSVQINKPPNVDPGEVTLYAVCVKADPGPTPSS